MTVPDGPSSRFQVTQAGNRSPELRETEDAGNTTELGTAASSAPPSPKLPFQVGQFVATSILARGGMSITFVGHVEGKTDDRVVIKVPLGYDPETLKRFTDEVAFLKELDHPSIVRVRGAGESTLLFGSKGHSRSRPWLAMDYIEGQTLRQRVKTEGAISWPEVRSLLGNIVEALDYLHGKGLCHRDIKPDNLVFDPTTKRWVLVDFGIAKSMLSNPRLTLTLAGQDPGSWDYMSPEQLDGHQVDSRTDIYSLGKTAWEALVGKVPRVGTSLPSVEMGGVIPVEVDVLIQKMVAHDAEARYQTPMEVAEALQVGALRIEQRKQLAKSARVAALSAAALVVCLLLALSYWFVGDLIMTQRARALAINNGDSPTKCIRELSLFTNAHRVWGRRFADEKIASLAPLAAQETRDMQASYAQLGRDLDDHSHPLDWRQGRASNFIKRYQTIFYDTQEIRVVSQKLLDLDAEKAQVALLALQQRESSQAEEVIVAATKLMNKGQTKGALELCDNLLPNLSTPGARQRLQAKRTELVAAWVAAELIAIDATVQNENPDTLVLAEIQLENASKSVGVTREIADRQSLYDARLWAYWKEKSSGALKSRSYNQARDDVRRYAETSRFRYHAPEVDRQLAGVSAAEDDNDWTIASDSASKNIAQRTYKWATKDIDTYRAKWPQGRHAAEATTSLEKIISSCFDNLTKQNDLDIFVEEFADFRGAFPQEQARTLSLKKRLCFLVHGEINRTIGDGNAPALAKKSRILTLSTPIQQCYPESIAYLRELSNRAIKHLENNTDWQDFWSYQYQYERPPVSCIKMPPPRVFHVVLQSVAIDLSESFYKELSGLAHADPRLLVTLGRKDENTSLINWAGPKDTRSFTAPASVLRAFFVDTSSGDFSITLTIKDDDDMWGDAKPLSATWRSAGFAASGTSPFTWSDGTKATITYTSR